ELAFPALFFYLLDGNSETTIYPLPVILDILEKKGVASSSYFDDELIAATAKELGATHAVYGMVQSRDQNQIRYFVKVADLGKKIILSPVLEYTSEQGNRFFSIGADTISDILRNIGGKKTKGKSFKGRFEPGPSYEAFRYHLKGMEKGCAYNLTDLAVAKIWFDKATSLSYNFTWAFAEKMRVLHMSALLQRQIGKDFSLLLEEVREAASRSGGDADRISGRWQEGLAAFHGGASYLNNNNAREALTLLTKAVSLLPEDGLAHYYLSQAGGTASGSELTLARELNRCIQ
ncbi:MAG: hypothetical protein Q8Q97_01145, partial [bacterium]|nr:hypothetical protein [bacterium]